MQLPCVIDIEASGLGCGSYPIEVGIVTSTGTTHCTLIKPAPGWSHWCTEAEQLHGISRQLLKHKGKSILTVANWLNELLENSIVYSDGWGNDMCWLGKLFDEAGVRQRFRIESILTLLDEAEKERWTPVHQNVLDGCTARRHRASLDAKIIQQTFQIIKY